MPGKAKKQKAKKAAKPRAKKVELEGEVATSIRALARAVGRSDRAVRKWMDRDDWPFLDKPWPIEGVRIWMANTLDNDGGSEPVPGAGHAKDVARAALIEEQTQLAQLRRMRMTGELVERAAVETERLQRIHFVKSIIMGLPERVADMLIMQPRDVVVEVLEEETQSILRLFAGEYSGAD